MKKKEKELKGKNYLERKPMRADGLRWSVDKDGIVTLSIDNTGFFNRLAQKFFKRPKVSHIHLDRIGSFVWPLMDGKADIIELGKRVDEHFGKEAIPLYERLAKFFQVLDSYHFVAWKD